MNRTLLYTMFVLQLVTRSLPKLVWLQSIPSSPLGRKRISLKQDVHLERAEDPPRWAGAQVTLQQSNIVGKKQTCGVKPIGARVAGDFFEPIEAEPPLSTVKYWSIGKLSFPKEDSPASFERLNTAEDILFRSFLLKLPFLADIYQVVGMSVGWSLFQTHKMGEAIQLRQAFCFVERLQRFEWENQQPNTVSEESRGQKSLSLTRIHRIHWSKCTPENFKTHTHETNKSSGREKTLLNKSRIFKRETTLPPPFHS